jgi:hypothetical protein
MNRVALGLALVVAVSAPAMAQRVSKVNGNRLLALCKQTDITGCDAYVAGVADTLTEKHAACIPPQVTTDQLRAVVLKTLNQHPEKRELSGAVIVLHSLTTAYPCK